MATSVQRHDKALAKLPIKKFFNRVVDRFD